MIKQFRSLSPLNLILLVLTALLLRIPIWDKLVQQSPPNFQELFDRLLLEVSITRFLTPPVQLGLGLLCLFFQALLFSKVINKHNLIGKSGLMPALLYIVCGSLFSSFAFFSPVMLCNFLIIWLLNRFLNMYRQAEVRSLVFDVGMAIGVGTIIYLPFIAMLPIIWISLMIFRPFNWREWFIGLLGFLSIAFFLGFYYYWNDAIFSIAAIWLPSNPVQAPESINYWALLPFILIGILGLYKLRANFFRSVVHIRKSYQLLFAFFLLAVFSAAPWFGIHPDHYLMAVPPVSVLLAYYFMHADKRWIYEGLFLCLLLSVFYFQFFDLFNFF